MALDNYGWFVIIVVALALTATIVARVLLYKKHRRAAQLAASRGLPFPNMTHWGRDRPEGVARLTPGNVNGHGPGQVVRVESRTDGDLPSYHDPGVKIPEAMYNPSSNASYNPYVPATPSHTDTSAPPPHTAVPVGAPPSYETAGVRS